MAEFQQKEKIRKTEAEGMDASEVEVDGAHPVQSSTMPVVAEEEKLRLKYPSTNRPMAGHSAFLQKRLAKGQKYFDSGDYQMAKQKSMNKSRVMPPILAQPTGEAIPTPESVPVRKTSLIQHNKLSTAS